MARGTTCVSEVVWPAWSSGTTATAEFLGTTWRGWNAETKYEMETTSFSKNGWKHWVTSADCSTTSGVLTLNVNTTACSSATVVWDAWTQRIQSRNVRASVNARVSAEERARCVEAERLQRAVAIGKADKLLVSVLDAVQKQHLAKHEWFLVRGQNGTLYRIRKGRSMNVDVLDKGGKIVETLCAYPGGVPDGDAMVAQKLMLECDQQAFLRLAIKHAVRSPAVPHEALTLYGEAPAVL